MTEDKRPALLIGSINLADRDEVLDEVATRIGDDVRSVPDGETGDRGRWIDLEATRIAALPQIETIKRFTLVSPVSGDFERVLMAPAEGVDLAELDLGPFNYVDEASASYEAFRRERDAGRFPAEVRFQVSLPTPMMFSILFPEYRREALAALERAFTAEIEKLFAAIPAADLALQWDVAGETQLEERFRIGAEDKGWDNTSHLPIEEVIGSIARVSAGVPEEALLGIHLCYGDAEGKHPLQPRDLGVCVDLANSAAELIDHRLDWIHMPVPIERDDDAYFEPLANLRLEPETQLYLGLLHKEDGIEGARRRIGQAATLVEGFGVATECGMGREPRPEIAGLLDLHHQAASL